MHWPEVSAAAAAAFSALTLAAVCLWLPGAAIYRATPPVWTLFAALAVILGLAGGLVDGRGLASVLAFAAAGCAANRAGNRVVRIVAHAVTLGLCAGFFLHAIPGFANPHVLDDVVLSPRSAPYTK